MNKRYREYCAWEIKRQMALVSGAEVPTPPEQIVNELKIKSKGGISTMALNGIVGFDVIDTEVNDKMQEVDDEVFVIRLNSPGGSLDMGRAIANNIKTMKAKTITVNDAFCGSIASIIFAAGDERVAMDGSNMMIHRAMAGRVVFGNVDELMEQMKEMKAEVFPLLKNIDKDLVKTYSKVSNLDKDKLTEYLNSETTFNQEDQIKYGFATTDEMPKELEKENVSNLAKSIFEEVIKLKDQKIKNKQ